MSFEWPWIFILAPLPLFLGRATITLSIDAINVPPSIAASLDAMAQTASPLARLTRLWPWALWLLALLALSQPSMPGPSVIQPASGRAMTLAIDLSGSMRRDDFEMNGVVDTRLNIVKHTAGEFIQARKGDRIGLVLFGDEAFVASPLSFDLTAVTNQLNASGIGMAGRSTAIGDALGLAIQTLKNDVATEKAIVLLSDGTNNAGQVEPESAAELASSLGIRIHTIAMGSDKPKANGYSTDPSADLDELTLKQIAQSAGGTFFRATTSDELTDIYTAISQMETFESDAPPIIIPHDLRNRVLLLLLSLLLIGELWRRWRR